MSKKGFGAANRPNLLIIITDQERSVMHFPEHWAEQNLPAMTLLKKHGVEFLNGCCNACMCSPSRSTLFSGLYPAQHGVTDTLSFGGKYSITEPVLNPSLSSMAQILWEHYDVQYRGKWHMSKGGMNAIHPEKSLMQAEVAQFAFRGWTPPDAGEDIALPNFGGGYANHDERYIQEALDFIRQWKTAKAQGKNPKPFALVVSLVNPHDVLSYPKTYEAGGYVDKKRWLHGDIGLPATLEEDLMHNWKPAAQWQLKAVMALSLGELKSPHNVKEREYINFYGKLMRAVDQEIAQLLGEFYEQDSEGNFGAPRELAKETLILRLADHGEMGLAHGGLRQKAFNVYDETLRVPFIFSNPEVVNPSGKPRYTTQPAGLIDIIPTLAGLLELTPPEYIRGTNLAAAVLDPHMNHEIQESHLFTFDDVKTGNKNSGQTVNAADRIRCVRTKEWKYARYFDANGSYAEEYELYYIKGIEFNELHQGDPADPMDLALKGKPYEYVNLAYEENPLFQELPEAAKIIAREALSNMKDLLKRREKDMLTGTELKIRQKVASNIDATN
jgi:arylsulfatase A-like enzyme